MSEMKLCSGCGHFSDRTGECDVARIDPVTGDQQKLPAIDSRRYYCGVLCPVDFKEKEPPKPQEPEHKGCPFCGDEVFPFRANELHCVKCKVWFVMYGVDEEERWNHFNRRAENRLPEIKKCGCSLPGNPGVLESDGIWFYVRCSSLFCSRKGRIAKTQRGAIENWNG